MKITFITLFPDYFEIFKSHSIIKNAINKGLVEVEIVNPRDFTEDGKIDDTVYGGGDGMLMMVEPVVKAIESVKSDDTEVYLLGPRGPKLTQSKSKSLSKKNHIVLLSGHYEGIDSRIKYYIDGEISIGDYILTGGEMPSMIVADSIIRLVDGVIKEGSHENESFSDNYLEHDHFTKPSEFRGHKVPEVLLDGNHKDIERYRNESSRDRTIETILEENKGE